MNIHALWYGRIEEYILGTWPRNMYSSLGQTQNVNEQFCGHCQRGFCVRYPNISFIGLEENVQKS